MKAPWIGSLFVVSGLLAGSATAQQEVVSPTSPSPYGVGTGAEVEGTQASTQGAPAPAPANPVANAFGPGVADPDRHAGASNCDCSGQHGCPSPYYGSVEFLWLRWKK